MAITPFHGIFKVFKGPPPENAVSNCDDGAHIFIAVKSPCTHAYIHNNNNGNRRACDILFGYRVSQWS